METRKARNLLIVQELCKGVNCGFAARGGRSAIESVPLVTQLNESWKQSCGLFSTNKFWLRFSNFCLNLNNYSLFRLKQSTGLFLRYAQLNPKEGGAVVFAPPRNGSRHSSPLSPFFKDMRLRARGRSFALCKARQGGSAPLTPASCAQLDQLISGGAITLVS